MYHFKNNYALEVRNISDAVDFYQKALGLIMHSLNETQTECTLENPGDQHKLMLSQRSGFVPFSVTIYSTHISEAMALHEQLNIVKEAHPREARYSIADPDGNIIHIHAEVESVVILAEKKTAPEEEEALEGLEELAQE